MKAITTIITKSHIAWALALHESLMRFSEDFQMYILITDTNEFTSEYLEDNSNISFLFIDDFKHVNYCTDIVNKYSESPDFLRWSLKPILIFHLLTIGHSKVMFCDCDIYFYGNYQFLWDDLEEHSILLTPHWFNPHIPHNIQTLHTTGIMNGGFVGASQLGKPAIEWWSKMCLHRCTDKYGSINVDQGYLEFMPFLFDKVKILKHKGCNVSYWSIDFLERKVINGIPSLSDGKDDYPLVFYHFARNRYSQFYNQDKPFFNELLLLNNSLAKFSFPIDVVKLGAEQNKPKKPSFKLSDILTRLKQMIPYRIYKITE